MRAISVVLLLALPLLIGCERQAAVDKREPAGSCDEFCRFLAKTDKDRGFLGNYGMRLYIEPAFGDFSYRFEIVPQPKGCTAIWPKRTHSTQKNHCSHYYVRMRKTATRHNVDSEVPKNIDFRFILPKEDGVPLFGVADELADRSRAESLGGLDGTSVALELVKRGKLRFFSSHGPLDPDDGNPAAWVATELHSLALAYGPSGEIPRLSDWHSHIVEDEQFPCDNPGLNTPDPDGFGVGDDACARSLAVQSSR